MLPEAVLEPQAAVQAAVQEDRAEVQVASRRIAAAEAAEVPRQTPWEVEAVAWQPT